ncbi:MAG: iron-containing alcohol dehydrogenase, partial [Spirochaetia bacterium]|nr:iron-containing alcohol dehydrogenase [Spirochaetia bacterium]
MNNEHVYVIGEHKIKDVPHIFRSSWKESVPYIIADENTSLVGGNFIIELFEGEAKSYIFPSGKPVYADYENVLIIKNLLAQEPNAIAIAVGSGTINDLVKLASYELEREYMLFPTAPSVDGYTAVGSALTFDGFKKTIFCSPPAVLVADVAILRKAPSLMIAAGYGDLAAKVVAGADWLLADSLGVEPIDKEVWSMVQLDLRENISQPEALYKRNHIAIERLFDGLAQT